ncbi:hydrolase [Xanthovirga aplysinae]|uniref:hydrolase n=1 Tax=Xanthovirga aplysinae TaxID=2529853 RepID=UPI0012BC44A0|nr:hydrolase [Xanthovirga aplysinae]MTI30529.1 hydrolase [Xanthovirga aplysinae]
MKPLKLNIDKTALVIIDLQKGIVGLKGKPNEIDVIVSNAAKLADKFRSKRGLVALVNVDFQNGKDALNPILDEPLPPRDLPQDWSNIVPELCPKKGDLLITKRQWGAFFGTELDLQLRRRGIDTLLLCGISTNIGVETTAREAYQRNYNQIFVVDAMNALSREEHDHTIKYIFPRMGRNRLTQEVLQVL